MDELIDLSNIWPDWEAEKIIGRGSYGVVYRASSEYRDIRRYSAIKVITIPQDESELDAFRYEGMSDNDTRTYYQKIVADIIDEINMMVSLHDTPNIVNIYDFKVVEHEDRLSWDIYIRMELLTPLNVYLSEHDITEEEVIRLGKDICCALSACEQKNIIHRDIKPENIFVNEFGIFKLGDFGIARRLENLTFGMSQKGTFNYMAPEVVKSMVYDHTSDIYSLGLVLYKLLNNGRLPFLDTGKQLLSPRERKAANDRRLNGEALPVPANASPRMAAVILKACDSRSDKRYQTAEGMFEALQGNDTETKLHKDTTGSSFWSLYRKWAYASAAIILSTVIAIVILVNRSDDGTAAGTMTGSSPDTASDTEAVTPTDTTKDTTTDTTTVAALSATPAPTRRPTASPTPRPVSVSASDADYPSASGSKREYNYDYSLKLSRLSFLDQVSKGHSVDNIASIDYAPFFDMSHIDPNTQVYSYSVAKSLIEAGDYDGAEAELSSSDTCYAYNLISEINYRRGYELVNEGKPQEAGAYFLNCIDDLGWVLKGYDVAISSSSDVLFDQPYDHRILYWHEMADGYAAEFGRYITLDDNRTVGFFFRYVTPVKGYFYEYDADGRLTNSITFNIGDAK